MATNLLVLSAPFGSGHRQAAQAIAAAYTTLQPAASAAVVDVRNPVLDAASAGYLRLIDSAPQTYRTLYKAPVGPGLRRLICLTMGSAIHRAIERTDPAAIVCTHPFPGTVVADLRRRGRLTAPTAVAVTDFLPHPLWIQDGIDHYYVSSDRAAERLRQFGIEPDRISATGIPIGHEFGGPTAPAQPLTDHGLRHVLVMGGGLGLGPIVEAVRSLAVQPHANLRVTVVSGQNRWLEDELQDLFGTDRRFDILGFTSMIPHLMRQAHLLVTKPGGLTCSEALAHRLPMLLLQPLPGHEEENAEYLTSTGAARIVDQFSAGDQAVALLYGRPESLALMAESARRVGRPEAAVAIAGQVARAARESRAAVGQGILEAILGD